jgi:hypothetical protein
MKKLASILSVLFLVIFCCKVSFADDLYGKYLTSADVEKVSGINGIKEVPRDPSKGAGGNLNFADADDNLVMMATFSGNSVYEQSKKQKGYFKSDVKGVGEEAFSGPSSGPAEYVLVFRKGVHCVSLSSFFNIGGPASKPTMLSKEELIALGKEIAGKL